MSEDVSQPVAQSSWPLVSVITPCLNPGWRLERCIRSVVGQDYQPIEHIVVDGGSTDEALTLLNSNPQIRWVSEPDDGHIAAINKGFRMATGSILTWLNADDELAPGAVHQVVNVFARYPELGWVYGNCEMVEGGTRLMLEPPSELREEEFEYGNPIAQPGTFFADWAWRRVGGLDESYRLSMDYDLWLRLFDQRIPHYKIEEKLAIYELHPAAKSGAPDATRRFLIEDAIANTRSGRFGAAAFSMGRAAAHAAREGGRISRVRLAETVEEMAHHAVTVEGRLSRRRIEAAAATEATILEGEVSSGALRHLLSASPWRFRKTRQMAIRAVKTVAAYARRRWVPKIKIGDRVQG